MLTLILSGMSFFSPVGIIIPLRATGENTCGLLQLLSIVLRCYLTCRQPQMPLSFLLFIFSSFSSFSFFLLLLLFFSLLLFVFSCPPLSPWSLPHEFFPLDLGLATRWPHLGIVNLNAYSRTPLLNKVTLEDSRIWGMSIAFQRALQTTAILDPWQLA